MTSASLTQIADEIELSLWKDLINPWFPACVDSKGGFWQVFDRQWERKPSSVRGVVFHSRMTWVAATLSDFPGPRQKEFAQTALHGAQYLSALFVAPDSGAVRWKIDGKDRNLGERTLEGHAYGASFAIYALAAVHRYLDVPEVLYEAKKIFGWLERYVHDSENGGYFECVDAKGKPILVAPDAKSASRGDDINTPFGLKSQNTHLHLMEAFAELAKSWPDPLLLERLAEVKEILEEKLYDPAGYLYIYAKPDWTPVPDRVSYGHDIEAAHLLLDAAETLGQGISEKTYDRSRALVDNTLLYGMDKERGGFYTNGTAGGRPLQTDKNWWTQSEALLGLAKATELPGAPVEEYLESLTLTWNWIRDFQIDQEDGGWFEVLRSDGTGADPEEHKERKGHMWKAAYHETRGLVETARIIRKLSLQRNV